MDPEYIPGGRWVRVLAADGTIVEPRGRWHLATEDPSTELDDTPRRAELVCGRELRATRARGEELAFVATLPLANLCVACHREWHREQLMALRASKSKGSAAFLPA
ncbi:MAG: hypothetical protein RL338_281 [Chloroflexota bacterium]|jgi:hypothetical protein